jgi:hypothetical protein
MLPAVLKNIFDPTAAILNLAREPSASPQQADNPPAQMNSLLGAKSGHSNLARRAGRHPRLPVVRFD